jgi:hypothetical protein
VPGIADLRIQQVFNYPQINVDVDRTLAGEVGLTERDVANSLLVTLSGSGQVASRISGSTPKNGVSYPIVAQMPQYGSTRCRTSTTCRSRRRPDAAISGRPRAYHAGPEPGRRLALQRAAGHRHLRRRPGRDLGAVSGDIERILQETRKGRAARLLRRAARPGRRP